MGRINYIERAGNKYYIVNDRSNLYVMDFNFILLRHKNVKGRGSGVVAYFYDVIPSNEDFHSRKENVNSSKTLVTDSEV